MRLLWMSFVTAVAVLAATTLTPAPAAAQVSVSRSPTGTNPALGRVVRGTATSTFAISPAGVVTQTGGNAIRMTSGGVTGTTVTISCGLFNCGGRFLRVAIQATGATGGATLTSFRVGSLSGTTYRSGSAPAAASSLTFDLNAIGGLGSCSFALGMDVQVPSGAVTGAGTYTYSITVNAL